MSRGQQACALLSISYRLIPSAAHTVCAYHSSPAPCVGPITLAALAPTPVISSTSFRQVILYYISVHSSDSALIIGRLNLWDFAMLQTALDGSALPWYMSSNLNLLVFHQTAFWKKLSSNAGYLLSEVCIVFKTIPLTWSGSSI